MSIINSVNTNSGAMIALESLDQTNQQLSVTQKQVSTGFRVADSTDDGAAYAIALSVRSTVGALTSANQQLNNAQGLLSTTQSSLNSISNTMSSMRDVLVKMSDNSITGNERTQYQTQYNSMASQVQNFIKDAGYAGKSLIGNITGSNGQFANVSVSRNEQGSSYTLQTFGGSAMIGSIAESGIGGSGLTTPFTATQAAAAVALALGNSTGPGVSTANTAPAGVFVRMQDAVGTALNTIGSESRYVTSQVSYNNNKIDALNTGLGALVDADLAKESAQLTALQIRQQLGTQALSLANQAPQSLLSLFK